MVQLKTNLCSICKKKRAVFYQKHSGLYLCRKDFIENFERRIRRTIHKYNMFREDDVIVVGVSGGKDSLTLLYILNKFEKRFPKSKLIAIMIDEGIKGYREEGVKLTKKLTEELGIPLKIFSYKELYGYSLDEIVEILDKKKFDVAAPCSYCGVLRRRALNYGAKYVNATKLATAHNLDDEAQTVLMNILRSDIDRIGRSGPVTRKLEGIFVRRVKPMRTIPEREVVLYAYYNKIPFHSVECPYAPRAFRWDIREFINRMEKLRPSIKYALLNSGDKIRELITETKVIKYCEKCGEPSTTKVCKVCRMFENIGISLKRLDNI